MNMHNNEYKFWMNEFYNKRHILQFSTLIQQSERLLVFFPPRCSWLADTLILPVAGWLGMGLSQAW